MVIIYLKPYNLYKLFVLDKNTWNHINMFKLFVLRMINRSYNHFKIIIIIIIHLKSYDYVWKNKTDLSFK